MLASGETEGSDKKSIPWGTIEKKTVACGVGL